MGFLCAPGDLLGSPQTRSELLGGGGGGRSGAPTRTV